MKTIEIAAELPGKAYDGTLTFVGTLRRYFVDYDKLGKNNGISKRWNADITKSNFLSDYERRIIPTLIKLFGKEKPLHSYTGEDFEKTLESLNMQHHYADSTLLHYRHLLWVVYQAGFEHGLYVDNIFWGDIPDFSETDSEQRESMRVAAMTRIRKSFSIEEELRIIQWFKNLDPSTATGEDIGLLLMFFLGLRNNESCGSSFGCIHTLSSHPDMPVFEMIQSTEIGSNALKAGGKTRNAPRILPLFIPLNDFLLRRRDYLLGLIESGELILPPTIKSVDQLPLVCVGHNYTVRASTQNLTKAGRDLFNQIGIDKSELALLYQIIFSHEFKESMLDEKEPTTYLFRRNCATHLYQLGFTSDEIQYWLGHDIEDPHISRNSFADEDTIYGLGKMLEHHPLYAMLNTFPATATHLNSEDLSSLYISSVSDCMSLKLDGSSQYLIDLAANEPNQTISVNIKCESSTLKVIADVTAYPKEYPRTADIRELQYNAYKNKTDF